MSVSRAGCPQSRLVSGPKPKEQEAHTGGRPALQEATVPTAWGPMRGAGPEPLEWGQCQPDVASPNPALFPQSTETPGLCFGSSFPTSSP